MVLLHRPSRSFRSPPRALAPNVHVFTRVRSRAAPEGAGYLRSSLLSDPRRWSPLETHPATNERGAATKRRSRSRSLHHVIGEEHDAALKDTLVTQREVLGTIGPVEHADPSAGKPWIELQNHFIDFGGQLAGK